MSEKPICLKHSDQWKGKYREIGFEVVHWGVRPEQPKGIWNYYLYVPLERLPESAQIDWLEEPRTFRERHNRKPLKYRTGTALPDLEFHSGCTLYTVCQFDDGALVAKVGCDYDHAWDQDYCYTLDEVARDARHSIDKLWEAYPDFLHECYYCAGYYAQDEGQENEHGWLCTACEQKRKEEK